MHLKSLLVTSRATDAFKSDVESYFRGGAAPRVELAHSAPPIKVQRLLAHLLEAEPDLEIERVSIDARSGCSDFRGTIRVETADAVQEFEFTWCCRWRAEEAGFTDFFGYPDQIRAAMVFKWRCFKVWRTPAESSIASSS